MAAMPFGKPFSKKSNKTAPDHPRPTASFLANQTIPPKKGADLPRTSKKRHAAGPEKGEPTKKGKGEASAQPAVSVVFGEIAQNNISSEDVKVWSGRSHVEAVHSFKCAMGEAFYHGLSLVTAREKEALEMNKSLSRYKGEAESLRQQLAEATEAKNKAEQGAGALQREVERLNGVLGEAVEVEKKKDALHAAELETLRAALVSQEADKDKELSETYTAGFLGYLKAFLGAHFDYDWSAHFPPSTVRYMEQFKVDNAQEIEEERALHESKLKAELEALVDAEAKKSEVDADQSPEEQVRETSPTEGV